MFALELSRKLGRIGIDDCSGSQSCRRVASNIISVGSTATSLNRRIPLPWRFIFDLFACFFFQPPDGAAQSVIAVVSSTIQRANLDTSSWNLILSRRLYTCYKDTTSFVSPVAADAITGKLVWATSEEAIGRTFDVGIRSLS